MVMDRVAGLTGEPALAAAFAAAVHRLHPARPPAPDRLVALPVPAVESRSLVVAGPGVLAAGPAGVGGLRALAAMTGAPVLNTFGAKGVLRWDDPAHAGTAGLQRDDFFLGGVTDADLVITTGLDADETTGLVRDPARTIDVPPAHLRFAAGGWPPPTQAPTRPPLYVRLSETVGPLYASDAQPPPPPRAVAALSGRGLVVADPGAAGFWVARTFPTTEPGSVVVPARPQPGFAAAAAVISALEGRHAVAVTVGPLDDLTLGLLDLARIEGLGVVLQVWTGEGEEVAAATAGPTAGSSVRVEPVRVDWSVLDELVAVAGPVVAWT